MNTFIESQCRQLLTTLELFDQSIDMAALKDDGVVSAEEAKQLKKLHKATEKCAADIRKVIAGK